MKFNTGDRIVFDTGSRKFKYIVDRDEGRYFLDLENKDAFNEDQANRAIFSYFGLDKEFLIEWATVCYGHPPGEGAFPEADTLKELNIFIAQIHDVCQAINDNTIGDGDGVEEYIENELNSSGNFDRVRGIPVPKRVRVPHASSPTNFPEESVDFCLPRETLHYYVKSTGNGYFLSEKSGDNFAIFDRLQLEKEFVDIWAAVVYGYKTKGGIFPIAKREQHLDRFVTQIHEVCSFVESYPTLLSATRLIDYIINNMGYCLSDFQRWGYEEEEEDMGHMHITKNNIESVSTLKLNQNGKTIKISRPSPSIRIGEKRIGHSIYSRQCKTAVKIGYLSYREISE